MGKSSVTKTAVCFIVVVFALFTVLIGRNMGTIFAQEESPSPSPSAEISPVPSDSATPVPSVGLTPSPSSQPTESPTPSPDSTPSSQPEVVTTPAPTPNESPNPPPSENPTPAPSVTTSSEEGQITAVLFTDKSDYSPTQTAVIFGNNFTPNQTYTLEITSDNLFVSVEVTADSSGNFAYSYQLDGTYRPLYNVVAKDSSGAVIAITSFTDAIQTDFAQCSNKNPTLHNCVWIGSIVQSSNSQYFEGMTVPQRLLFRDAVIANGVHHITFTYQYTKAGIHAYDFLTTVRPDASTVQGNTPAETLNSCANLGGADTTACNSLSPSTTAPKANITVPSDSFDSKDSAPGTGTGTSQTTKESNYEIANGGVGSRKITVYAPTAGAFSAPSMILTHSPAGADSDTGDTEVSIDITFTSSDCSTGSGCNYLLYFGGHLALTGANNNTGSNWGPGLGSSQISGGPYHIKSIKFDGTGGSQDNQIKGADILVPPGSISLDKVTSPSSDPTSFSFTTTNLPSPVNPSLTDAGTPIVWSSLANGTTYTITENAISGWSLTSKSCTGAIASVVTTLSNGVSIALANDENVVCTFTNTLQQGTIELKKIWSGTGGQTTLNIGTTASASNTDTQLTGAAGAAPLTTGQNTVSPGTYFVSETGGLTNYGSSLACFNDANNNGVNDAGDSTVTPGGSNSVAVASNQHVICTFTNTRNTGTIELKKVWVGTGGQTTLNIGKTAEQAMLILSSLVLLGRIRLLLVRIL